MIYKISQNQNKLKSLAICDTTNLCGALEFAEKISKVGTQPIIGTQINFKYNDYHRFVTSVCAK
jgi:DNA polymerase III alpha subunit